MCTMAVPSPDTKLGRMSFALTRRLKEALEDGDAWKTVADSLNLIDSGRLRVSARRSPVEDLLLILVAHECTVGALCEYLRYCQLYDVLALLKDEEPLEITLHPDADGGAVSVERGKTLRLKCEARGIPGPRYAWCRENEELPGQTSSQLVIHNFSLEQEGVYYCAVSQHGKATSPDHSQEVEVTMAPVLPCILQQPPRTVFQLTSTEVILECHAEGHPAPRYQWFCNNTLLQGKTSAVLKIPFVSDKDEGEYRCRVENAAGELFSETCILKTYKPSPDYKDPSSAPKVSVKVALLIGNKNYSTHLPLKTPWEDVKTLAKILKDKGFMVIALKDLTLVEMRSALRLFCRLLCKAAYGVFYFAGHGFELIHKYMMPVDVPGKYRPRSCLTEKEVVHCAQKKSPHLILLIPDMCLSHPSRKTKQKIYQEQLEDFQCSGDKNMLIACTTTSGQRAYERESELNGEYMTYLKKYLPADLPIEEVLRRVRCSMPGEQSPLDMSNVGDCHVLSVPAEGNKEVENEYRNIAEVKEVQCLHFPEVGLRCVVSCHPLERCFLNAIEIVFHGIDVSQWDVRCETLAFEELIVEQIKGAPFHMTVIHNLQKAKLYRKAELSLQVTVNLYQRQGDAFTKVSNVILDLGYPLITSCDLWLEAPSCSCKKCEAQRSTK